jgi:hypothetical protein
MGMITITLQGSFGHYRSKTFTAMEVGHAGAVAEAIRYLASEEMPQAINNDHGCHRDGIEPSKGFGGMGPILAKPEASAT